MQTYIILLYYITLYYITLHYINILQTVLVLSQESVFFYWVAFDWISLLLGNWWPFSSDSQTRIFCMMNLLPFYLPLMPVERTHNDFNWVWIRPFVRGLCMWQVFIIETIIANNIDNMYCYALFHLEIAYSTKIK